jgi:hypothetical protein
MLGAAAVAATVAAPTIVLGRRSAAHASTRGDAGKITFRRGQDIWIAEADGSGARLLAAGTQPGSGNWSPDGSRFVYATRSTGVISVRPDGSDPVPLLPAGSGHDTSDAVYVHGGRNVMYTSRSKLSIVPSGGTAQAGGPVINIPDDGKADSGAAAATDGTVIYQHHWQGGTDDAEIYRIDSSGTVTKIIDKGWAPDFSPDSSKIAFVRGSSPANLQQIWVADADGSNQVQLTTADNAGSAVNTHPTWSPDGRHLLFTSHEPDAPKIKRIDLATKLVVTLVSDGREASWQPITNDYVDRVWGRTALETAVAASRRNWTDHGVADGVRSPAKTVVLSRDDTYLDALGGSALAAVKQGPLLITPTGSLHPSTQAELQRILGGSGVVYLLGGTVALSATVERQVRALGYQPVRLWGQDEHATAVAIAKEITPSPGAVIVATALTYYDALAAGAAAGANPGTVIVLTAGDTMPAATAAYLNTLNPDPLTGTAMIGVGGPGARALAAGHRNNQMPDWPDEVQFHPVFGATEFETAVAVADFFFEAPRIAAVATAATWHDALAGGAMIGANGGPLLLSDPTSLSTPTRDYYSRNSASLKYAIMLGGPLALKDTLIVQLGDAVAYFIYFQYREYTEHSTFPLDATSSPTRADTHRHGPAGTEPAAAIPGTRRRKPTTTTR